MYNFQFVKWVVPEQSWSQSPQTGWLVQIPCFQVHIGMRPAHVWGCGMFSSAGAYGVHHKPLRVEVLVVQVYPPQGTVAQHQAQVSQASGLDYRLRYTYWYVWSTYYVCTRKASLYSQFFKNLDSHLCLAGSLCIVSPPIYEFLRMQFTSMIKLLFVQWIFKFMIIVYVCALLPTLSLCPCSFTSLGSGVLIPLPVSVVCTASVPHIHAADSSAFLSLPRDMSEGVSNNR